VRIFLSLRTAAGPHRKKLAQRVYLTDFVFQAHKKYNGTLEDWVQ
jgi:hypothetical protein